MLFGERFSFSSPGVVESSTTLSAVGRGLFAPPLSEGFDSEGCPSTPPAQLLSPQPRTPRPSRFLSPPRTPLSKLFTNFPTTVRPYTVESSNIKEPEIIARPESACSNYSSSSDSSFDSLTTFTTAGGSCTSPGTESSFFHDESVMKEYNYNTVDINTSICSEKEEDAERGKSHVKSRLRKVKWTEDMDGHLWRTYVLCQQDPKVTPFFVLPGQVPPLGVCHRVAREAKRSWKEARMGDGWKSPLNTASYRQRRLITPAKEAGASGNRGDVLRKTSPYSWPASEASTRKRLRELCRLNYGPSRNPHHGYHQQRRPISTPRILPSRGSTVSPSPYQSVASDRLNSRDAFLFSTRSIALSLTMSTASTMNPNGVLATIAAGYGVDADMTVSSRSPDTITGGISERVSRVNNTDQGILGIGSFVITGRRLESGDAGFNVAPDSSSITGFSGTDSSVSARNWPDIVTPVLLPPLELSSSSSAYGTWPRRQKRQEELECGYESVTLPPPRRARRGTIGDLFGEPVLLPTAQRTRPRGYTIGSSCGNSISRRRYRPLAPLLTVTGPVSYESPNDGESLSPLASRELLSDPFRDLSESSRRLGSPFVEKKDWKGKELDGHDELSSEMSDEDFLKNKCRDVPEGMNSARPAKRVRE